MEAAHNLRQPTVAWLHNKASHRYLWPTWSNFLRDRTLPGQTLDSFDPETACSALFSFGPLQKFRDASWITVIPKFGNHFLPNVQGVSNAVTYGQRLTFVPYFAIDPRTIKSKLKRVIEEGSLGRGPRMVFQRAARIKPRDKYIPR